MSNTYLEVAAEAQRLLAGFTAVQTVAAAFADVGTLEQAKTEREAALADLALKIDQAKADLATAQAQAAEGAAAAAAAMQQATADAASKVAEADAYAATTKAAADAQAAEVIAAGKQELADAKTAAQAASEQLAKTLQEVDDAQSKLDRIRAKISEMAGA